MSFSNSVVRARAMSDIFGKIRNGAGKVAFEARALL